MSNSGINVDRDDDSVTINGQTVILTDEDGVMEIDHTSSMDGYVAFRGEDSGVALQFLES